LAASLSEYDDVLKEDYAPAIVEQLSNNNILLNRIERDQESVQGKEVYLPLHTKRNVGIGARGELVALPSAGNQGFEKSYFPVRYHYGRIEVPGPLMAAAASNKGAFINAMDSELRGMATDFRKDIQRALFQDGLGKLALCGSITSASTTVNVVSVDYLNVGDVIDCYTAGGSANFTNRSITAIDPDSSPNTITISGAAVTTAATDIIVHYNSYDKELHGLGAIVNDTGTLQGINGATAANRFWRSYISDNSGTNRVLSEALMQVCWDNVEKNDGVISLMLTTYGVRRAYLNLLTSLKRFSNTIQLEGGFSGVDFNGKPLVVDADCPSNLIYFLDESHLRFFQMNEPNWADEDGAVLSRVSGYDAWEAFYCWYVEFGTDKRNVFAKLADITEA